MCTTGACKTVGLIKASLQLTRPHCGKRAGMASAEGILEQAVQNDATMNPTALHALERHGGATET